MRSRFFNFSRRHPAGLPAPLRQAQRTRLGAAREPGHQVLALAGWLVLCLAASGTAFFVSTGGWFAGLRKPSWNPPPWIFGPVWTLLYILMAVAAWLVWREGGWKERSWNLRLFVLQWLLNVLWTPLFFGMHLSGLAFAEIVVLWFAVAATMVLFWKVRKAAGVLLATLSGVGELRRHAKLHHLADEPMRHRYA